MKTKLALFSLFILFACNEGKVKKSMSNVKKDDRTYKEIEDLIVKNDTNLIFLRFWAGMNKADFQRVKAIENRSGNLKNGKFPITFYRIEKNILYNDTVYSEYLFKIADTTDYIELVYQDEYFIPLNSDNDGSKKGEEYEALRNQLIKTFDSKYKRLEEIKPEWYELHAATKYYWKKKLPNKTTISISLEPQYWYYDWRVRLDNFSQFPPEAKGYADKDESKKQKKAASCNFKITYEKYEFYLKGKKERDEITRNIRQQEKEEILGKEKSIKKSKDNL